MSKVKAVKANIKLVIAAGQAKPAPPVGPALGQAGLNIMAFCKEFNAKTADFKPDVPIPVRITAYEDKTFTWVMKSPPASYFVKQAAGLKQGSQRPGHSVVASIGMKQLYAIAEVKQQDTPYATLEAVCKSVMGTAKSMGVDVVDDRDAKPDS